MPNNYLARFEIEHGVSQSGGPANYDDVSEHVLAYQAGGDSEAILAVFLSAKELAMRYILGTNGRTVSRVVNLSQDGRIVDQRASMAKALEDGLVPEKERMYFLTTPVILGQMKFRLDSNDRMRLSREQREESLASV